MKFLISIEAVTACSVEDAIQLTATVTSTSPRGLKITQKSVSCVSKLFASDISACSYAAVLLLDLLFHLFFLPHLRTTRATGLSASAHATRGSFSTPSPPLDQASKQAISKSAVVVVFSIHESQNGI